jgi:uncharacterized protein (DUF305 family)
MKNSMLKLMGAFSLSLLVSATFLDVVHAAAPPPAGMPEGHMKGMDMKGMGATDMKAHMMKSMHDMQNMTMTGNADKDFAMMMRMHHQCGVEMAQMQLANGKNAEMKTMATKIIASQKKEIAQFDTWIAKQK